MFLYLILNIKSLNFLFKEITIILFPLDVKDTTLSEMTTAKASVLAGTFSLKYITKYLM